MDANKLLKEFRALVNGNLYPDTEDRIKLLETTINKRLPESYRSFLKMYAYAHIKEISLASVGYNGDVINSFDGVEGIVSFLNTTKEDDRYTGRNYADNFITIGSTGYHSILLCLGYSDKWYGKVVLVNYEQDEKFDVTILAETFEKFLYDIINEYEKLE